MPKQIIIFFLMALTLFLNACKPVIKVTNYYKYPAMLIVPHLEAVKEECIAKLPIIEPVVIDPVDVLKAMILADPENLDAHYKLGSIYSELGLYDKAIEEYREAVRIEPDYAEVYYNLGLTYLMLDNNDSAFNEYNVLTGIDARFADELYDAIVQNVVLSEESNYFLQVAAFKNIRYANEVMIKLKSEKIYAFIEKEKKFNKVLVPGIKTIKEGKALKSVINKMLGLEPYLLKAYKVR